MLKEMIESQLIKMSDEELQKEWEAVREEKDKAYKLMLHLERVVTICSGEMNRRGKNPYRINQDSIKTTESGCGEILGE